LSESNNWHVERKPKCQFPVLREEKVDNIRVQLEHSPHKHLKSFAQELGVSKNTTRNATKLLKLWPYKITVHFLH
jgi:hypothetical protein